MSLTPDEVRKIARLARLAVNEEDLAVYARELSAILDLVAQMDQAAVETVEPLAHPLELAQRLRPDEVTEQDRREQFQALAPQAEAGLFLVPKMIE